MSDAESAHGLSLCSRIPGDNNKPAMPQRSAATTHLLLQQRFGGCTGRGAPASTMPVRCRRRKATGGLLTPSVSNKGLEASMNEPGAPMVPHQARAVASQARDACAAARYVSGFMMCFWNAGRRVNRW